MRAKIIVLIFCALLGSVGYSQDFEITSLNMKFLKKPTGPYSVGFEDFHLINQNICPDFNFNKKNQDDFSPTNIKHCHEIMVRIYYPISSETQSYSSYYAPFINSTLQEIQAQILTIPKSDFDQLKQINSFSVEKAEIVKNQQFPVLFFIPGLGWPSELYDNSITELASQGYIVIGINSSFINLLELPNGHIVDPDQSLAKSPKEIVKTLVPLQKSDLTYVYNFIKQRHKLNDIFLSMDLEHIGIFGHSMGGVVLADVVHEHPTWFQAGATLDIGFDESNNSRNKFSIPFMHEISSIRTMIDLSVNRKSGSSGFPITFKLGKNGYLVGIAPDTQNHSYSNHPNFSDYSTLQYNPAFKKYLTYLKEQNIKEPFDVKIISHELTKKERDQLAKKTKKTYVLAKVIDGWRGSVYVSKAKQINFDVNIIKNLRRALDNLPSKFTENLSKVEIEPIVNEIVLLHKMFAALLGEGNGWVITDSINTYLVKFFDVYLKEKANLSFNKCTPLHKDTYIKCGPDKI